PPRQGHRAIDAVRSKGKVIARSVVLLLLVAGLTTLSPRPAYSQAVENIDVGGRNLRLEVWNQSEGDFSWNVYTFQPTHNFDQSEVDAITRGVQYWVDVLEPGNTPGRDMVFRVVRDDAIVANSN